MSVSSISPETAASNNQAQVQQEIGVRTIRLALDAQATEGAQLVQMLNQSVGIGRNINTTV
jgi:hypothetical protein